MDHDSDDSVDRFLRLRDLLYQRRARPDDKTWKTNVVQLYDLLYKRDVSFLSDDSKYSPLNPVFNLESRWTGIDSPSTRTPAQLLREFSIPESVIFKKMRTDYKTLANAVFRVYAPQKVALIARRALYNKTVLMTAFTQFTTGHLDDFPDDNSWFDRFAVIYNLLYLGEVDKSLNPDGFMLEKPFKLLLGMSHVDGTEWRKQHPPSAVEFMNEDDNGYFPDAQEMLDMCDTTNINAVVFAMQEDLAALLEYMDERSPGDDIDTHLRPESPDFPKMLREEAEDRRKEKEWDRMWKYRYDKEEDDRPIFHRSEEEDDRVRESWEEEEEDDRVRESWEYEDEELDHIAKKQRPSVDQKIMYI
jgi:hypothetical protein